MNAHAMKTVKVKCPYCGAETIHKVCSFIGAMTLSACYSEDHANYCGREFALQVDWVPKILVRKIEGEAERDTGKE